MAGVFLSGPFAMTVQKELALFEINLAKNSDRVTFSTPLYRNVYVANGDVTLTDELLVQRHAENVGCHCRGALEMRAEADGTRLWVWQIGDMGAHANAPDDAVLKQVETISLDDPGSSDAAGHGLFSSGSRRSHTCSPRPRHQNRQERSHRHSTGRSRN